MFDDQDDTPVSLTINKAYANKYQNWREKEEKQKRMNSYDAVSLMNCVTFYRFQWLQGMEVMLKMIQTKNRKMKMAKYVFDDTFVDRLF